MDFERYLDPAGTRRDVADEVRRNLSPARALFWDKMESERLEKGVSAALSYVRALLEEASQAVRGELDAVRGEARTGG